MAPCPPAPDTDTQLVLLVSLYQVCKCGLCLVRVLPVPSLSPQADLERGERVFCPPLDAALQPCDVASLLKQFLRELPQPLVPADLQGALCQAQTLEAEGPRDRATLLLTALLPPAHARTLRYFCTFLSRVAHRSGLTAAPSQETALRPSELTAFTHALMANGDRPLGR